MRARRGFTLAEVLAAVAVMAIVLPVAMYGVSLATSVAGLTKEKSEAVGLAEWKLNELVVTGEWQTGKLQGNFGQGWERYRWRAEVATWDEPNVAGATYEQVQLHVTWMGRGGEREVVLSTVVYTSSGVAGSVAGVTP